MGVIINTGGGGAGGGIRYNAETDMIQVKVNGQWVDTPYKAYGTFDGTIYDNGVQAVPLDNTGYPYQSTYTSLGGASLSSISFSFALPGAPNTNRCIVTDDAIDMTPWNTLHVLYNGTHKTVDLSSVNESAYVLLSVNCAPNSTYNMEAVVTRTKQNYGQIGNYIAFTQVASGAANVTGNFTKIWLE